MTVSKTGTVEEKSESESCTCRWFCCWKCDGVQINF